MNELDLMRAKKRYKQKKFTENNELTLSLTNQLIDLKQQVNSE